MIHSSISHLEANKNLFRSVAVKFPRNLVADLIPINLASLPTASFNTYKHCRKLTNALTYQSLFRANKIAHRL